MRCIVLPTRPRRRPRCVEGCCAFKRRSAKRLRAQAIDGQGNITRISQSSYVYDALGRRLKKAVKDETGKERITYYGWDGDRLVHTERMKDDGTRDIVHTVYEPGTFTPMLRLSTNAKGDPQAKPHLMVQAAKAVVPEQQQDDANTTTALQGLQGAMSGMPEAMRKMLEQGMKQALQGGLSPMAKSVMGGMGIDPDALIQTMNRGMEEERRKEQTPIDILFYHCDHLGTPIALTDQKGQIAWAAKHDPWGNQEEEFNPRGIEQDIRLPGQHYDRETGLYYNRHRYYDPKIGSYTNQDPIGLRGGVNFYSYSPNPIEWIDPLGLSEECACNNMTVKRNPIRWDGIIMNQAGKSTGKDLYGHHWLEIGSDESYGYWPNNPLRGLGETIGGVPGSVNPSTMGSTAPTRDPDHGKSAGEVFHPKIKGGAIDGIDCIVKCKEAADCFRDFAKNYSADTWAYPGIGGKENCHTFQKQGMEKCNLED